jgi:asparagine synthase (glutamine-hydrolysing)
VKFRGGQKKYLLKKGLEPLLDRKLLYRKKAGFNVPKNVWLRGPLRELVADTLSPVALARHGLLEPTVVQRLLDEHQQRRADHSFAIWSVFIFQLWYDRFVAGHTSPARFQT